jgi:hypothetical protein
MIPMSRSLMSIRVVAVAVGAVYLTMNGVPEGKGEVNM